MAQETDGSTDSDGDHDDLPQAAAEIMLPPCEVELDITPMPPANGDAGVVTLAIRGGDPGRLSVSTILSPADARAAADRLLTAAAEMEADNDE